MKSRLKHGGCPPEEPEKPKEKCCKFIKHEIKNEIYPVQCPEKWGGIFRICMEIHYGRTYTIEVGPCGSEYPSPPGSKRLSYETYMVCTATGSMCEIDKERSGSKDIWCVV